MLTGRFDIGFELMYFRSNESPFAQFVSNPAWLHQLHCLAVTSALIRETK